MPREPITVKTLRLIGYTKCQYRKLVVGYYLQWWDRYNVDRR